MAVRGDYFGVTSGWCAPFRYLVLLGRKKYPQLRNEFVKRSWKTVCWVNDFLTAVNESQVLKMMSKTKAERFEDIFVRTLVSWRQALESQNHHQCCRL